MRGIVYKSVISIILITTLVISDYANAQAQTVIAGYTARLNLVIGRLVTAKMARWGIAANDPRVAATVKGIETGLTVAAGVGMVGGASISWPALLLGAGLSGIAGGALKLASDKNFTWSFGAGAGTVTATGTIPGVSSSIPASPHPSPIGPIAEGQIVAVWGYNEWVPSEGKEVLQQVYSSDLFLLASLAMNRSFSADFNARVVGCNGAGLADKRASIYPGNNTCQVQYTMNGANYNQTYYFNGIPAPVSSATNFIDKRTPPPETKINTTYSSAKDAVAAVPDSIKKEKLSPDALAAVVNTAWKAAADPNSSGGVPWSASDPITPSDALAWTGSNASAAPTVGDFTAPANHFSGSSGISIGSPPSVGTGGSTSPGTTPGTTTPGTTTPGTTTPGTNPGTTPGTDPVAVPQPSAPVTPGEGTKIDWGPNPNIGAPMLESTPTAASILDPIFNVMPDLKNFGVPNHASVCPTAGFTLYGNPYLIDVHCSLFDQNRQVIAACAVLCFTLASLFIVLRA